MLMIDSIKSILLFFGPMLLPKAISYYKQFRANSSRPERPIRPIPPAVSRALAILFAVSLVAFIATLPAFSPENLFNKTQSRVQIPVDVLFTRVAAIRPHGLTLLDKQLREKLLSLESKLLYLKFGPDAIANCLFCTPDDHTSYIYYALPSMLAPHLFNISILALVTSGLFVGPEGAVWRRFATLSAIIIASVDIWFLTQYDHQINAKATRLEGLDMFFWKSRVYRCISIAGLDALLGWLMYLSSTNRAFAIPVSPAERLESTARTLEGLRSKLAATGVVRNTVNRDEGLRSRTQAYWVHEGRLMGEVMEDREVMESVNNALESRVDVDKITADADAYAKNMMGGITGMESEA
jgi:hypothetical protein